MTGLTPEPVGASRFISAPRAYSVLVSLYGDQNGNMNLNFREQAVLFLSSKLLGDEPMEDASIDEDTFDAISEIGNMVAGRFKELLMGTSFEFEAISLPAMIVGANYSLYHSRGIISASVEFEIEEMGMKHMRDKFFTSSISLMRK